MKVKEFVEMYKKNMRIDIDKTLEVKKYIGFEQKVQISELVLDNCTYEVDDEIHVNSIERYILFTLTVIGAHTNLEFSHDKDSEYNVMDEYDMLCEEDLLGKVIDTFKDDYAACQEILNMVTSDRLQTSMTIEKKVYQFFDEVVNILNDSIGSIIDKLDLDSLNNLLQNKDSLSQVYKLIEKK